MMCPTTSNVFSWIFRLTHFKIFKSLKISAHALYCTSQVRRTARGQRAKVPLNCSTQPDWAVGTPQSAITGMLSNSPSSQPRCFFSHPAKNFQARAAWFCRPPCSRLFSVPTLAAPSIWPFIELEWRTETWVAPEPSPQPRAQHDFNPFY